MTKQQEDPRTTVIIDRATSVWVEGLPLGNGDVGAMVYGGPEQVTLAFNKSDVWDYRVNPGQGLPQERTTFDEMVAMAAREDWQAYNKLFAGWLAAENSSRPSLQSCGQLAMTLVPGERPVGVRQVLDMGAARARVRCEYVDYRDNKQTVAVEAFVPARECVTPVTITSDKEMWGTLRLSRPASLDYALPQAWRKQDVAGIDMAIPESLEYTLAVRVLGATGRWETTEAEAIYTFEPCGGPIVLLVTIVTSRQDKTPRETAFRRLCAMDAAGAAALAGHHEAWWADFWGRSSVSLPEERLERFWRLGMYVLGAGSRPGSQAAGLQGLWNHYNRPCWHTDYHADMNVQMIHWPAYSGNHLELTEPYYRMLMVDWREETRRAAREFFGRRGMYLPIAGSPGGHELAAPWAWPGAGAWIAQHFWWHWLYSRDLEFARQTYPYLEELSLFYEDLLQKDDAGVYNVFPSYAPEMPDTRGYLAMAWGRNPTGDLAFIRILFNMLVEFSAALGADPADRARWADIRDRLADYPVGPDGRLRDLEGDRWAGMGPMPVTLAPLYPACDVGLDSPPARLAMLREAYQRASQKFRGAGHLMTWFAAAAAHLGDAAEALRLLHDYLDLTVLPNGLHALRWVPHFRADNKASGMMQIEATTAFANALNEMLLQSLDGVLRVFPAVPEYWTASFHTLRAAGAFLVSAAMKNGRLLHIRILSECGGPCVLTAPIPSGRLRLRDPSGIAELAADSRGRFTFPTEAGGEYELTPVP